MRTGRAARWPGRRTIVTLRLGCHETWGGRPRGTAIIKTYEITEVERRCTAASRVALQHMSPALSGRCGGKLGRPGDYMPSRTAEDAKPCPAVRRAVNQASPHSVAPSLPKVDVSILYIKGTML
jgi:hypothetical protein